MPLKRAGLGEEGLLARPEPAGVRGQPEPGIATTTAGATFRQIDTHAGPWSIGHLPSASHRPR